jgi:hypothetical protein
MQYALIFYDLQLILAPMPRWGEVDAGKHRVGTRGEPFPEIT